MLLSVHVCVTVCRHLLRCWFKMNHRHLSVYSQSAASVDDSSVIYSSVITFRKAVSVSSWDLCKSDVQFWQGLYVCLVKKGHLFVNDHYFCISIIRHWNDTVRVMMQKWDSQSWSCLFTAFIFTEFRRWCDLQLCETNIQGWVLNEARRKWKSIISFSHSQV